MSVSPCTLDCPRSRAISRATSASGGPAAHPALVTKSTSHGTRPNTAHRAG
ncbi:MAG: hypothetical protein E6K80_14050 [Candidatus Eisenbacteria bacterium]|uniref:Uncharacterized protein n=1 Tax=Eiseniibacteriota bacterium TaxID=2212470 RepID=A0A538TYE0_UNCEI|nr:MAG: hypothetical protein E6K80_14050 [Candidatus Eisenbacteria bacterium]